MMPPALYHEGLAQQNVKNPLDMHLQSNFRHKMRFKVLLTITAAGVQRRSNRSLNGRRTARAVKSKSERPQDCKGGQIEVWTAAGLQRRSNRSPIKGQVKLGTWPKDMACCYVAYSNAIKQVFTKIWFLKIGYNSVL